MSKNPRDMSTTDFARYMQVKRSIAHGKPAPKPKPESSVLMYHWPAKLFTDTDELPGKLDVCNAVAEGAADTLLEDLLLSLTGEHWHEDESRGHAMERLADHLVDTHPEWNAFLLGDTGVSVEHYVKSFDGRLCDVYRARRHDLVLAARYADDPTVKPGSQPDWFSGTTVHPATKREIIEYLVKHGVADTPF